MSSSGKCFGWGILGGLIAGGVVVGVVELIKHYKHENKKLRLPWVLRFQTNEERPSALFVWAKFTKNRGDKTVTMHLQPFQASVASPCNAFAAQLQLPVQLMPVGDTLTKPVKLWKLAPGENSTAGTIVDGSVTLAQNTVTFNLSTGGGAWAQGGGMGLAEPIDIVYHSA
jgi:hypothetical protein